MPKPEVWEESWVRVAGPQMEKQARAVSSEGRGALASWSQNQVSGYFGRKREVMFWRGRKRKFWDGKTDLLIITYLAPQMHPSVHALQMEFP